MSMTEGQKSSLLVISFLAVVGLIVIGYFHFMFGRGIVTRNEKQRIQLAQEVETLRGDLAQIEQLVAQQDELQKQAELIQKVTQRLPSSPDAPGFLNALLTTLRTTGIVQEEVKPDRTTERALYTEIPYNVRAHGHYHAIGQFLTLIEQNPERFMRVKNMRVSNNLNRPSIHPIEMEITTFMFKD